MDSNEMLSRFAMKTQLAAHAGSRTVAAVISRFANTSSYEDFLMFHDI